MKVLFQSRTTLFSVPGGDTIQVVKTAESLRRLGCTVEISTELQPDVSSYDLVHLFNLIRPQETFVQAKNAVSQGKPMALSTIFVDLAEYEKVGRMGLQAQLLRGMPSGSVETLKVIARAVKNFEVNRGTAAVLVHGYRRCQEELLSAVNVLLPNSRSEHERVVSCFPNAEGIPAVVVPNAVDKGVFGRSSVGLAVPPEVQKLRGCVLCVGRIEDRKGQLMLARAVKNLGLMLVLIGKPAPNHVGYLERIKREAGETTIILGEIPYEQLPKYYSVAKVHALVSWMETTGLVSLEAAAMGANIVITEKGDTRDYFGDDAYYCDPASLESVEQAVHVAYLAPSQTKLRDRVLQEFTWERAAECTMQGYEVAMGSRVGSLC